MIVCALVSKVLLHRFSSFSGTAIALFTVFRALTVRDVTDACGGASQCIAENIELYGTGAITEMLGCLASDKSEREN